MSMSTSKLGALVTNNEWRVVCCAVFLWGCCALCCWVVYRGAMSCVACGLSCACVLLSAGMCARGPCAVVRCVARSVAVPRGSGDGACAMRCAL